MTVQKILDQKGRDVLTIDPKASLGDASKLLAEKKVGAVVVTDSDLKVLGILSERDVIRIIGTKGADGLKISVSEVMTKAVQLCAETDTINAVMSQMTRGRFRHLPVQSEGKLAGIISIGDVVKRRIEEVEREADEIRNYIAST